VDTNRRKARGVIEFHGRISARGRGRSEAASRKMVTISSNVLG
jgi:hypothetical protein